MVTAAVTFGVMFRFDIQTTATQPPALVVLDRWTGAVAICTQRTTGYEPCLPGSSVSRLYAAADAANTAATGRETEAIAKRLLHGESGANN